MEKALEDAIKALAEKSASEEKPSDAMQRSQAALNLAHVLVTWKNVQKL